MNRIQTFQEFLATTSVQIPVLSFVINLLLAALLSYLLGRVYIRYGRSLSNRHTLSHNFMLITMTTMLIISIVKSSLALSLGLVGALSIVRFRAAIKEPEELAYLFLSIGIGLGLGADQARITIVAFAIIVLVLVVRNISAKKGDVGQNLHITVFSSSPGKVGLKDIVDTLNRHCSEVNLRRFDESGDSVEASFVVGFKDFDDLTKMKNGLQELNDSVRVSFLDNKGFV